MNLALVIETFDPQAGGAERSTAQIAGELAKRGHRVCILAGAGSGGGSDEDLPDGVVLHTMSERRSSSLLRLLRFSRWARRQLASGRFDASLSVTMAAPAKIVQPRGGTVRETLLRNVALRPSKSGQWFKRLCVQLSPKQQALLALERRTLADPGVQKIVAVSRYVVEQLRQHYGINDSRVVLIPNAAQMPTVDDQQKRAWRKAIRTSFSVPADATVYLFAAQNPRLKGLATLIEAARLLVARGQKLVVLFAGCDRYTHHQQVVAAGVRDQFRFLGQTRQMPALYGAADVTVLPSFYDPASKVVIESLMMGTPAISTAFNGASDMIAPEPGPGVGLCGRVIADPADAQALAQAMEELADPAQRARCAAETADLAASLSIKRHVDALEVVMAGG